MFDAADRIAQFLRGLSNRAEFAIVIVCAFGAFTLNSLVEVLAPGPQVHITNLHLRSIILYELPAQGLLVGFLALRGWSFKRFGLSFCPKDIGTGVGLALLAFVVTAVPQMLLMATIPELARAANSANLISGGLAFWLIAAVSILNPLYEELFVTGYVITAITERRNLSSAINASIVIRLIYHVYQGVIGIVYMIPLALLFAAWFGHTRRLWPLVVAHAVLDFVALLPYAELWKHL